MRRASERTATDLLGAVSGNRRPVALTADQRTIVRTAVGRQIPFTDIVIGIRGLQRRLLRVVPSFVDANIDAALADTSGLDTQRTVEAQLQFQRAASALGCRMVPAIPVQGGARWVWLSRSKPFSED